MYRTFHIAYHLYLIHVFFLQVISNLLCNFYASIRAFWAFGHVVANSGHVVMVHSRPAVRAVKNAVAAGVRSFISLIQIVNNWLGKIINVSGGKGGSLGFNNKNS